MTATSKLGLELLQNAAANQTLANTTFTRLNQIVQAGVVDKDLSTPPASPAEESLYIVADSATGLWAGHSGQLAYWITAAGAWQFITPREGFFLHVNDEDVFYKFNGTSWEQFSGGGGGMANPMTTIRDLIVGGVGGTPTRLAGPASEGLVLTRIGSALAWAIATGFANPMTAAGDLIVGGTSGSATRLGAGAAGQVLTIVSGAPAWANASVAGGDFKKDGSVQMTGPLDEGVPFTYNSGYFVSGVFQWDGAPSNTAISSGDGGLTFTGMNGAKNGSRRLVKFGANETLVHTANVFDLPGAANIATQTGDSAEFIRRSSTRWQCLWYQRADGKALAGAAPSNTDGLTEGTTNLYFTAARVLAVALTGLSLVTGSAVVASDSILVGVGKLQKQITDLTTAVSGKEASITGGTADQYWNGLKVFTDFTTSVRASVLTGLSLGTSTPVTATDSVLTAIGKLQAQLTGSIFRTETIATTTVGQTSYAVPNGYMSGSIVVFFNGALLAPADYTATDGANVVLAVGAQTTSDLMSVVVLGALRAQDDALLQYTVAGLPAASANAFKQRWCTNMAGRAGPVYSDGTNWRRYVDDSIVTV